MKKLIFFLFIVLSVNTYSQSPSNFTYQSVVRDGSGKLLSNKEISFRISVLKNSESGQVVFEEEHSVTTNINGLATLIIGKGSGNDDLGDIDWGDGSYFLKVEIDPEGGFNFIAEDTTQLLSVPYALYSSSSGSSLTITGQDYLTISNNEITVNQIDLSDDVVGILPIVNGGTGSSTAPMVGVITAADAASARNVLGLSTVASTGSYNDLTDKLTAGTNIDITNGVISSTDTDTTYTAGTGISIDGNNAISSTITQYTDANAQAAFTAGTNIDITNGVISSTDTDTTYTAGTGISIDGNNAISTTVTDTDTVRSVTAGGNTLADGETLAFTAGSNVTITENAGAVTISSTDTDTTYTAGTGISIDGNNSISSTITQYTDANAQAAFTAGTNIDITNGVISSTDTNTEYTAGTGISIDGSNAISTTVTDTDTVRSVTAGGNTLADGETLAITAGSNVTITENAGAVTISSTDTNTTYSVGDGGLTQNNFTNALKSKLDGLNTPAIYDNSGSPALETGITAAEIRSLIGVDASGSDNSTNVTLAGSYDYLTLSGQAITLGQITNDDLAGSIVDSKLNQISTAGKVELSSLEIDGGTDIGAAITDSDLIIIDDDGGGTNRKAAVSRLRTYIQSATSLNDLTDVLVEDESYYFGNEPTNTSSAEKNIGIGLTALDAITTGDYNIAIGSDALTNNTTGNNNTAIGRFAMEENTSGYQNTALGILALEKSTSSGNNVAVGHSSLNSITDGEKNVGISSGVAPSLTTGDKNVVIGYVADVSANNAQNQIVIGHEATGLGNNYAVIGDYNIERLYAAEDAGATVYAGGINLSGGTTVSAVKFGTVTMSTNAEQAFTISGVTSNSIVTASFKSGDNGRYIKTVVPSTDTITITLDGAADNGVIMYIIIN